jgi:protein-S-isoprenylcysteine O-methyltransferase Ste14
MLIPWLNLISLQVSAFLFAYFAIISVMPVTRAEKYGDKAWKDCYRFRKIMSVFVGIMVLNMILWFWFPVPELAWPLTLNPLIGIIIGIAIVIPSIIILAKALKDGGAEHMKPSQETKMHGGIYNHIRHPGVWGEMPLYISIGFFLNSLFLILWSTIFSILFVVINIHYEERDLVKRFGDVYREYQQRTGALIPKFWRRKKDETQHE